MKIQPYINKLEKSQQFKDFKIKYPNAFLVAGFFVLDFESGKNMHQIDFYVPEEKKIAAFTLDEGVQVQLLEMMKKEKPQELSLKTKIDLDALEGILLDEMHNRGMSEKIKKIIAVVHTINGKRIWNLNCVLSGMEILNSHVEDESKTVLKIEKKSIFDVMQQIPAQKLMKQPEVKENLEQEMKNLDRLQLEIEKEKTRIQEEQKKKPAVKK